MNRSFTSLAVVAALFTSTNLVAQQPAYQGHVEQRTYPAQGHQHDDHHDSHHDDYRFDHDWERPVHTPDLHKLDEYSDRLAKIAEHLHEDAHKLSQDYEHSASIEGYVEQLEHLQEHMHKILHQTAQTGQRARSAVEHVKGDVTKSKTLMNRLYGELQHQGFDGARTNDFRAMAHMREIIVRDAFPLVRAMESELHGYQPVRQQYRQPVQTYRQPVQTYRQPVQSYRAPTQNSPINRNVTRPIRSRQRKLPSFRINF